MGNRRKPKTPKRAEQPETAKQPKAVEQVDTDKQAPVWRMGRLEMAGPFGWEKVDKPTAEKILAALRHYEGTTWDDLLVANKKHNHAIAVSRLCKPAQRRLKELQLDQIEELVSLGSGLGNKPRIFGIRDQNVLEVLWWDPEHQICPSNRAKN